jgi:ankyrin repeat protein
MNAKRLRNSVASYLGVRVTMRFLANCILLALLPACTVSSPESDPFSATDSNNASALRAYFDRGGDPNIMSPDGVTLLYVATGPHGGEAVLRLLLERGANPNVGAGAYSPLMNASSWCWIEGVSLLAEAGADLKARNEKGETALDAVCSAGQGRDEVIAYLRGRGL